MLCPRCGETFTYLRPERPGSSDLQTMPTTTAPSAPEIETSPAGRYLLARRANRFVAAIVLGVMFLMATVGLTFALWTQKDRRAHDLDLGKKPRRFPTLIENPPPEVATVAPARLAALGYLPPESNVVAGVHVAELLLADTGRELLTRPLKVGGLELRFNSLERWTSLKLDELDHVVLGLRAEAPFDQPAVLVVRTRQPYDAEKVRAALKAEQLSVGGDKRLDRFEIKDTPFRPVLWCADDHTLVLALAPAHFTQVPLTPRRNIDHLPRAVQKVLEERVGPVGPLWLAGHIAAWEKIPWPTLLPGLKKEDLERWTSVRTFAVWLQAEKEIKVSAAIQCRDAGAAHALETYFTDGNKGWKTAREEAWLSLQWKTDLDGLRQGLAR
jgi:hypothetical protein